ncbi:phage integrase [Methylocaldum sp.]|uniref:phage integrase n=1 Tax=Methylocaldum sp. TaxID=1969727 RepID=UPI003BEEE8CB
MGLKSAGDTYKRLIALCNNIGDPPAIVFTSETFVEYRSRRLAEGTKVATLNRGQATLSVVFSELSRIGKCSGCNPLAKSGSFASMNVNYRI